MKKILVILSGLLLIASIPITIYIVRQNQELRSKAAPASTLSLLPVSAIKKVGDTFNLEVNLDTAENEVFVVALGVTYDPTKLEAISITNSSLFPSVLEPGVVDPNGKVSITLAVAEQSPPMTGNGTVASIKFKALTSSTTPAIIDFASPDSFVGAQNEGTNVIKNTVPSKITINPASGSEQTNVNLASSVPTPTVNPSPVNPTATPPPGQNQVTIGYPKNNTSIGSEKPTIKGKAPPGFTVTITVYSDPQTGVVTADEGGNWAYTVESPLDAGPHNIVVSAQDPAGGPSYTANGSFVVTTDTGTGTQSATPVSGNLSATLFICILGVLLLVGGLLLPVL